MYLGVIDRTYSNAEPTHTAMRSRLIPDSFIATSTVTPCHPRSVTQPRFMWWI